MANPKYQTLTANTVATVTLDADYVRLELAISAASAASDPVYFTIGGATPAVATDGSIFLPGTAGSAIEVASGEADATIVKLKSAGTPTVQIRGL